MKIIYFTTSQDEKDYRSFMNIWKIPLNSSNQNFHNKFIRALDGNAIADDGDAPVIDMRVLVGRERPPCTGSVCILVPIRMS